MENAISHAVFPGVVLAYIIGFPLWSAFIAGLFSAIATGFLKNNSHIRQDTAMGTVFTGMFLVWGLCFMSGSVQMCIWIISCLVICSALHGVISG